MKIFLQIILVVLIVLGVIFGLVIVESTVFFVLDDLLSFILF